MNPAFQIHVTGLNLVDTAQCNLYLDLDYDHLAFVILENYNKEFVAFEYFNLDRQDGFAQMRDLLYEKDLLRRSYRKISIVYNFPDSVLIPEAIYDKELNNGALDLIYGDLRTGESFSEQVSEWNLFNTYRIPSALHQLMNQHFPHRYYWHYYSVLLKSWKLKNQPSDAEVAELIFYPNKLIAAVFGKEGLLLVQTFDYETAEDVSYHLLNVCQQLGIDCEQIRLIVKGLIDEQSSVFTELLKYFLQIQLADRPAGFKYDSQFDEFPNHFFTPLFEVALCV